jgi:hypothetical protein
VRRWLALTLLLATTLLPAPSVAAQENDPFADFDFQFLKGDALEQSSIAGPTPGDLAIERGTTHTVPAGVAVRDFYAHATFINPDAGRKQLFDVGFSFRRADTGEEFRLIIDSTGAWFFKEPSQDPIATGQNDNFAARVGARNEIEVAASGDDGYFAVNGKYVDRLDLSTRPIKGDIALGTGYFGEDQADAGTTPFADFEIWSLDEALPASDEAAANLIQLMQQARRSAKPSAPLADQIPLAIGSVSSFHAGVDARDFYTHAEFTNPYAGTEHLWDIGFGFRDDDEGDLRLAVDSDGAWFLSRGASTIYQQGEGAVLDTGAGGQNTLDLAAVGGVGYLAVNGQYVATLDLGARKTHGDVWASSGFFQEDKIAGETTPFRAFQVWSLDPPNDNEGDVIISGDGELIFDLPQRAGPDLFGVISLTASGDAETNVEIGAFDVDGTEQVGVYAAPCDSPPAAAVFTLNPFDPDALNSTTTVPIPFTSLTGGDYAIAVRAADSGDLLACSRIPAAGRPGSSDNSPSPVFDGRGGEGRISAMPAALH